MLLQTQIAACPTALAITMNTPNDPDRPMFCVGAMEIHDGFHRQTVACT